MRPSACNAETSGLPDLTCTDGREWGLYRGGERRGVLVRLDDDRWQAFGARPASCPQGRGVRSTRLRSALRGCQAALRSRGYEGSGKVTRTVSTAMRRWHLSLSHRHPPDQAKGRPAES